MPRSSSPCRLTTFFSPWRLLLLLLVLTTPVAAFHPRLPRLTTFFSPWRLLLLLVLTMPVAAFHPRLPHMPSAARTAATPTTSPSSRSLTIGTPRLAHGIESGPIVALLKGPDDMYESAVKLGTHKAEEPAPIMFLLAIQAGLQVGIGAAMAVATMAGLPGIHASDPGLGKLIYAFCGLPCGLLMTATTGTMLFTGNTALVSVAWMEKRVRRRWGWGTAGQSRRCWGVYLYACLIALTFVQIKLRQLLKTWILSYTGNLLGAAMLAALCTYAGVFKSTAASIASVAAYKSALPFGVVRRRAMSIEALCGDSFFFFFFFFKIKTFQFSFLTLPSPPPPFHPHITGSGAGRLVQLAGHHGSVDRPGRSGPGVQGPGDRDDHYHLLGAGL